MVNFWWNPPIFPFLLPPYMWQTNNYALTLVLVLQSVLSIGWEFWLYTNNNFCLICYDRFCSSSPSSPFRFCTPCSEFLWTFQPSLPNFSPSYYRSLPPYFYWLIASFPLNSTTCHVLIAILYQIALAVFITNITLLDVFVYHITWYLQNFTPCQFVSLFWFYAL